MNIRKLFILLACAGSSLATQAQSWSPKQAPLMSKFAKDVDPNHVLPEYPRPQMVRKEWLNLNGLWQYQPGATGETLPKGNLDKTILVPFPVESALSGVREHHDRLWYRRTFTVPAAWKGKQVILHFGAIDWESEVYVNGKSLGIHKGGYDPFSYNVTSALTKSGPQELTVRVYDPTDLGGQPRGKQTLNPQGIMYTSVTGIWQTVWLEPVATTSISDIKIVPDLDKSAVKLTVNATGNAAGAMVSVKVRDGNNVVKTVSIKPNVETSIVVAHPKLWSPDSPFLYDLDITLNKGGVATDKLTSYFGMRKISVEQDGGFKKLYLNNKFLFELGPLDQGFWPDGGYTAPTDAALKSDLEMIKKFGFNMVRKHIKYEPYRWYYWADKLGLMVWQDMPSPNSYTEHVPPVDTAEFRSELTRLIKTHWNSPSIINWVIFNEGQAQHNTAGLVSMVRKLDPSRLINQASGGDHHGVGDLLDIHSYPPPGVPFSKTQALACGEYGGIGYIIPGHTWKVGDTYIMINNKKDYLDLYDKFANDLTLYKTNNGLSAAVYTEITDVEVELNGLITYDREVVKGDADKIYASNYKAIHDNLYIRDVLPSSQRESRVWKYTTDEPTGDWYKTSFSGASWKSGQAGFGTRGTPGGNIKTIWNTDNIWIRQDFNVGNLSVAERDKLVLYIHHDEDCEVYINGIKAADISGYSSAYTVVPINAAGKAAIKANGKNVIAVHCKQTQGGQYIDAGIAILSNSKL
ncbi:sugar-binding domain-containing protein [Mucilaginibacter sp. dw_454]|uniref:glycoside hydrolase family 2 protein n=1 Tax=Mucilaginibacter sp. dw_454 TaxID=2720079 RepID=UPI001BD1E170|nr:sugar-binding domain-containing protein [Mucilaginibacter sp. dw_454]